MTLIKVMTHEHRAMTNSNKIISPEIKTMTPIIKRMTPIIEHMTHINIMTHDIQAMSSQDMDLMVKTKTEVNETFS